MEGMTTKKPHQRLARTPEYTVLLNCIGRIFRTSGCEAARWCEPRREQPLISPQDSERERPTNTFDHAGTPRSDKSSVRNSAYSRSQDERRGLTTISNPRGTTGHAVRRISLTLRRIRFLLTATPIFRGVVSPTRLWSRPLASRKTTKERESLLMPLL